MALTGTDETADLLRELEEGRRKAIAEGRAAEQARVEAQMLRRRYADELSNLEALRRESRRKAQEEARALIKRASDKVDNTRWPSCAMLRPKAGRPSVSARRSKTSAAICRPPFRTSSPRVSPPL